MPKRPTHPSRRAPYPNPAKRRHIGWGRGAEGRWTIEADKDGKPMIGDAVAALKAGTTSGAEGSAMHRLPSEHLRSACGNHRLGAAPDAPPMRSLALVRGAGYLLRQHDQIAQSGDRASLEIGRRNWCIRHVEKKLTRPRTIKGNSKVAALKEILQNWAKTHEGKAAHRPDANEVREQARAAALIPRRHDVRMRRGCDRRWGWDWQHDDSGRLFARAGELSARSSKSMSTSSATSAATGSTPRPWSPRPIRAARALPPAPTAVSRWCRPDTLGAGGSSGDLPISTASAVHRHEAAMAIS